MQASEARSLIRDCEAVHIWGSRRRLSLCNPFSGGSDTINRSSVRSGSGVHRSSLTGSRSIAMSCRPRCHKRRHRPIDLRLASPAPALARGLQKYDNRIVHCAAPPAGRREYDVEPQARASRLTANDHRWPAMLFLRTLTLMFAQNNSETDGLGCHQVNFASAVFLLEHLSIRPGARTSKPRRRAEMTDLTVNSDLFVDGLAPMQPFPSADRLANHALSAIQLSDEYTPRFR